MQCSILLHLLAVAVAGSMCICGPIYRWWCMLICVRARQEPVQPHGIYHGKRVQGCMHQQHCALAAPVAAAALQPCFVQVAEELDAIEILWQI